MAVKNCRGFHGSNLTKKNMYVGPTVKISIFLWISMIFRFVGRKHQPSINGIHFVFPVQFFRNFSIWCSHLNVKQFCRWTVDIFVLKYSTCLDRTFYSSQNNTFVPNCFIWPENIEMQFCQQNWHVKISLIRFGATQIWTVTNSRIVQLGA